MSEKVVLGTRGSDLALAQARLVTEALCERWADVEIEKRIIRTSGDEGQGLLPPVDLRAGRKGLFTAEIERALVAGEIDLAVHSAKDLPSDLNPLTEIAAALPRAMTGDVLISAEPYDLLSLPQGGVVATGSVRRSHQLRWKRPDLKVVDLRGNVPTRLHKLASSEWHAIILAQAGLQRLGLGEAAEGGMACEGRRFNMAMLSRDVFLPAGGQGVIAVQIRADDDRVRLLLESINHFDTRLCLRAERQFLRLLQADCNQPIGVLAEIEGSSMNLRGQIFQPEAITPREAVVDGPSEDAEALAAQLFSLIHEN
ncbi:MAG TPA: hydroxymethylbilane synthase [Chthoniobacterales bacterium]|jgi:hydroxymethylbilane synthase